MRNIARAGGVGDNVSTPEQIAANSRSSNQPTTTTVGGGGGGTGGSAKTGSKPVRSESTAGILFGIGAYGLWGLLPLYFFVLMPASAIEIVANRIVWSLLFCALLITITRAWKTFWAAVKDSSVFGPLALAAVLIAINWLTYTFGVTTGHAVETSLGYFINPLVSVLLGVFVLKEKLRPLQWAAVGIGFVAVGVLTFSYGQLPWIALILAFSFGLYGFVKKRVGPKVDALTSLSVETVVLAPFAAITMVVLSVTGVETLTTLGAGHFWLLVASGAITAVPLLFFGASARRLPMTTIGLLQYFAPVLQFVVALTVFNETMTTARWIGFCVVWLALVLLTIDMLRTTRKNSVLKKRARLAAAGS
ncbi:EamA family transporter RarD [Paenarthrobacter nitroguajacolicus]|uniref:EamA family transporter RarD n=1 Tax=Paenarthrobacter nitroguajacolicus TaxID=211146 RepID=UPI0015BFC01F|nr:EamA family transporter RarD [Paenarthrobacter nitroguajacolicus]NWL13756.1 EamA family transporter RarD [Paenarthrobacter nitroguajacolicus]